MLVTRASARLKHDFPLAHQFAVLPMVHINAIRTHIAGQYAAVRHWLHPVGDGASDSSRSRRSTLASPLLSPPESNTNCSMPGQAT